MASVSAPSLRIERVVTGRSHGNCWIAATAGGDALVVDPGDDASAIAAAVERAAVHPVALVATHAHADHIAAAAELGRAWTLPFVLHRRDEPTLRRANLLQMAFGEPHVDLPPVDRWLVEEEELLVFGDQRARAVATPGHTPGGITLEVRAPDGRVHLFTGDTLLRGTVGRTDLPGGSRDELGRSLRLLAGFPRHTRLHPGHGDESELGVELDDNAELREFLA